MSTCHFHYFLELGKIQCKPIISQCFPEVSIPLPLLWLCINCILENDVFFCLVNKYSLGACGVTAAGHIETKCF